MRKDFEKRAIKYEAFTYQGLLIYYDIHKTSNLRNKSAQLKVEYIISEYPQLLCLFHKYAAKVRPL